ncbi:DUF1425 domain-containing protein [Marinobacterium weihaiense]|uniref:YcfL family protein n=1 Tax=Marinobacterium weihaiense TaxID=2851016 RepID=A0ABS6MDQ5_9GAMM|nr:DUF1425 domain-containing protein [Marinobacterium weihaiense]MBV0934413.1 YcfL family protein [Marinobacterium weihaiense]
MQIRNGVLAAAALALLGCQTQPQPPTDYPQLQIGPRAQSYLQIEAVQEGYASSDLLRAGVRLYNRSNQQQTLRYRFSWFDANGFELKGLASRWEQHPLRPAEPVMIDRVAPSPKAVRYRIQLFDPRTAPTHSTQGIDG